MAPAVAAVVVVLLAEAVVARLPHPAPQAARLVVVVQLLDLVLKSRLPYPALLPVVARLLREAQLLRPALPVGVAALPQEAEVAVVAVVLQGLVRSEILRSR